MKKVFYITLINAIFITNNPLSYAQEKQWFLHTEANIEGGYDSNICTMIETHSTPSKYECKQKESFFTTGSLEAEFTVFPLHWLGFNFNPAFQYTGFYKSLYQDLIEPSLWLGTIFLLLNQIRIDVSAGYQWFRFDEYPTSKYHELNPLLQLSLEKQKHIFQLYHGWNFRWKPETQQKEYEAVWSTTWEYEISRYINLISGLRLAYQEGDTSWSNLCELVFTSGVKFSYRFFHLTASYEPGFIRYLNFKSSHFLNIFSTTAGFKPLNFLDISLSYIYNQVFKAKGPHGNDPAFIKHIFFITITFTWEKIKRDVLKKHEEASPPADNVICEKNECTFMIKNSEAKAVYVVGTFNRWNEKSHPLKGPDKNGFWVTKIKVPNGRHRYIFIIDGKITIPDIAKEYEDDEFGSRNAVFIVTGD